MEAGCREMLRLFHMAKELHEKVQNLHNQISNIGMKHQALSNVLGDYLDKYYNIEFDGDYIDAECLDDLDRTVAFLKKNVLSLEDAIGNLRDEGEHLAKDGIYLLRDSSGYEKTVEASFDGNGKLVRLVDKDDNNWIKWANDVVWTEPRESHQ